MACERWKARELDTREEMIEGIKKDDLFKNGRAWWAMTWGYFCYVVLGGLSWKLHRHVYTGDENKSVLENLRKGQIATFRNKVYSEFFFPAFLAYHKSYRSHVLMAGVWLVTGVYNLRNQPEFAGIQNGRKVFTKQSWHTGLSGYLYVISSAIKGVTAGMLSWYSHSLGFARYPMLFYSFYDVVSLAVAMYFILVKRSLVDHRRWMIRNFSVGAGSIWVRVFAAVWACADLEFMKSSDLYRKMNNIVLCTGFTMGPLFGEWWIARTKAGKEALLVAMAGTCLANVVGASRVYKALEKANGAKSKEVVFGKKKNQQHN